MLVADQSAFEQDCRTYTAFFETDDDGDELEPFVVYAGGYVNESLALFLYAASRATEVTGWDDAGSLIQGLSSSMPEGSWVCGDRIVPVRRVCWPRETRGGA